MKKHWHIVLAALSGMGFLLWLASCARLTYDDYLFAAVFKKNSFFEAINILSNTHTFRWTTFLLQDLMFGIVPGEYFPMSIFIFFALLYGIWIYQLGKLIRKVTQKYLSLEMEDLLSLSLAALFVTAIYLAASQAVENFTFSGAVCDRLVPLLLITMVLNLLLQPDRGWSTYLKLGLLALLIAGTAENSTITFLIVLVVYTGWKKIIRKEMLSRALIFFSVELIIFLAMELLSPGSDARYKAEKVYRFTCGDDNAYCADSMSLFLIRFFQWRQLFAIPIILLFFFSTLKISGEAKNAVKAHLKSSIGLLGVMLILTIAFHVASVQYVFGCYGPMRLWLPVNILLVVIGVCIALYAACNMPPASTVVSVIGSLVVVGMVGFYFSRHYQATSSYRDSYDDRVSYLISAEHSESVVEVEVLPAADLVVEGDIMTDENDDVNRDFADTYGLSFKVRRKK